MDTPRVAGEREPRSGSARTATRVAATAGSTAAANSVAAASAVAATPYYIFHGGVQYGPAALGAIQGWLRAGNLDETSLVWDSDQSLWVSLATFPPLLALQVADDPGRTMASRSTTRVVGVERPRSPEEVAAAVTGTAVYAAGFRKGRDRRSTLRLPVSLKLDFHVLDPRTRQPSSLLYSYSLENISIGGFGFSIFGTDIVAGSWIRSWIELEPENGVVALGEVVRVRGRRSIGVGFRDISDRDRLEEFLTRRRP